jgi:hypothetical protein
MGASGSLMLKGWQTGLELRVRAGYTAMHRRRGMVRCMNGSRFGSAATGAGAAAVDHRIGHGLVRRSCWVGSRVGVRGL